MNVNDGKYVGILSERETITQYEYRAGIHLSYLTLLEGNREAWLRYGDEQFHAWAINGYEEGIRHIEEKLEMIKEFGNLKGEDTMNSKRWYTSKTVWINLLLAGGILAQTLTGEAWLDAEAQGAIVVVVNLVLRLITNKPLSK